jgi:hypothetical protein
MKKFSNHALTHIPIARLYRKEGGKRKHQIKLFSTRKIGAIED